MTKAEAGVFYRSLEAMNSADLPSNTYVELGVKRAETSITIYRVISAFAKPFHFFGVDINPRTTKWWNKRFWGKDHATLICADTKTAIHQVKNSAPEGIAWVYVDACHCYECAGWDIENWGSLVVPGGHLLIHDTTPRRSGYTKFFQHGRTRPYGSYEAVRDSAFLKTGWKMIEEVDDTNGMTLFERLPHESNS